MPSKSTNKNKESFCKLMNISCYGKTLKNKRNRFFVEFFRVREGVSESSENSLVRSVETLDQNLVALVCRKGHAFKDILTIFDACVSGLEKYQIFCFHCKINFLQLFPKKQNFVSLLKSFTSYSVWLSCWISSVFSESFFCFGSWWKLRLVALCFNLTLILCSLGYVVKTSMKKLCETFLWNNISVFQTTPLIILSIVKQKTRIKKALLTNWLVWKPTCTPYFLETSKKFEPGLYAALLKLPSSTHQVFKNVLKERGRKAFSQG